MRFIKFYFTEEKLEQWINAQKQNPELKSAIKILSIINSKGYDALIVGGSVRDLLLDQPINDVDIATNMPMEEIGKIFKTHDIGKNKDFGVIVVDVDGYSYEIANFRADLYNSLAAGKGADKVEIVNDFKADAARRDFKMNSLGVDKEGNIIDHFNGIGDIKNKIISSVGDPNLRFKEDYIRMMRAIRQAGKLGFSIDNETMNAIKSNAPEIQKVAAERIAKEILKMAEQSGEKFAAAIQLLDQAGLLEYILPEIYGLKEMPHNPIHHPEGGSKVLGHVLEALKTNKVADPTLNLSILFHDVGKLTTHGDGDTYHGHAGESKPLINKIAVDLKLDNELRDAILFAAENHMKWSEIPKMSNNKIYQLMNNKNFDLLRKVAEADFKARGETKFDQKEWDSIEDKLKSLQSKFKTKNAYDEIKKIVNGKVVMDLTGLKPSKQLGDVIDNTINWIMDNEISLDDTDKIYDYIKSL